MKTLFLMLAAGAAVLLGTLTPGVQAARPFKGLMSAEEAGPFAEVRMAAVRHLLNFRKETPLTAEQKKQVREILKAHRSEIKAQFEKGREARRAMEQAVKSKGPGDAATQEAAAAIGEAARERALLAAKIGSEIRPLFTEEQQKRMDAARAEIDPMLGRLFDESAE